MNLLRDVSLDALVAFAEFAEDGNFSHAAIRLHISQPALHTKIAKLGRTVGQPLYVRRGRSIEITEAGRKVQRFARELVASTVAFQNELLEKDAVQPVVLAAGEGSFLYLLGSGMRAHLSNRRHALQLLTADGPAAVDAVRSGRAHLGVASLDTIPRDLAAESAHEGSRRYATDRAAARTTASHDALADAAIGPGGLDSGRRSVGMGGHAASGASGNGSGRRQCLLPHSNRRRDPIHTGTALTAVLRLLSQRRTDGSRENAEADASRSRECVERRFLKKPTGLS
jgi:DNA-binding transcriptional LysR family regulator